MKKDYDPIDASCREAFDMDSIISLQNEQGEKVLFEFIDLIIYQEKEYVALLPCDTKDDEPGEVVILEIEDNDSMDQESYVSVDDMEILEAVFRLFKERVKDRFEFVD